MSQAAPRPEFGASLNVTSTAPARPPADASLFPALKYLKYATLTQRGPMVDVLGPTITFQFSSGSGLQVFAARQQISGFSPGDGVDISITTPFSLRLIPQPASPTVVFRRGLHRLILSRRCVQTTVDRWAVRSRVHERMFCQESGAQSCAHWSLIDCHARDVG
jgi:hypothetical protein